MDNSLIVLQKKLTLMLFVIDEFCKKYKIVYHLEGGTALGAYRHKGFIPWDDDIDISMDIKEYRRFCKLFIENPPKGLVLQIHKTDKYYINGHAKIRDLNSETYENGMFVDYKYNGIFIDVFPYEYVNPTMLKISHLFLHRIQFGIQRMKYGTTGIMKTLLVIFYYLSIVGDSVIRYISKFLPTTYSYSYGCNIYARMGQWRKETFSPTRTMLFEGKLLPVPGKIEEFLSAKYGDYMRIPSEEERNHIHYTKFKIFSEENDAY